LIVDDDGEVRRSLRNLLLVSGFEVYLAGDGWEALKLLDRQWIDAAVIDLMMPRLDGVGVVRALLTWPEERRPRVVFVVSTHVDLGHRVAGLEVFRVFPKPFDPTELVGELGRALAARSA
jgi:two-component system response regulator MprA